VSGWAEIRDQTWSTFVRNHACSVLACDFFATVTSTFRVFHVFVVLEVGTRRILHWNVTDHPAAEWSAQQFRMSVSGEQPYRWVIHDRDSIYTEGVDRTIGTLGLTVLKMPVLVPQANAYCERLIGTIRRECLDWVIPVTEQHLRRLLDEWIAHYNRGRPHAILGPGVPEPVSAPIPEQADRHRLAVGHRILARPILGGLHHEYRLEVAA
jgi:putative transposase